MNKEMLMNNEEHPLPIIADQDGIESLQQAIRMINEIYEKVPEELLDVTNITVNAGTLTELIEMLLVYAALYEDVDTDELEKMAEIENSLGRRVINASMRTH
jgi:hypothetical protein